MTNDTPCHHAFDDGSTAAERCIALRQWRSAIYEALINWNDAPLNGETPKDALRRLIRLEVQAALDPAVSKDAAALVAQGKRAGLEEAAKWHDHKASAAQFLADQRVSKQDEEVWSDYARNHREYATEIRAMMEKKDEQK